MFVAGIVCFKPGIKRFYCKHRYKRKDHHFFEGLKIDLARPIIGSLVYRIIKAVTGLKKEIAPASKALSMATLQESL
jgi:hypothetical protein